MRKTNYKFEEVSMKFLIRVFCALSIGGIALWAWENPEKTMPHTERAIHHYKGSYPSWAKDIPEPKYQK